LIVTLLAMGVAMAQDETWKDCELAARDPDRSIAACSKILKRPSSKGHAAAYHHRGQAYAAKGKLDQAISDISAGIRLDPQPAYRWQARGELYARQGNYQQAIADITEAIQRDPTPRAFRFQSRAEAYQGLGDLTRAIADFDEAIRLDTEARSFRFRARANALRDAGQYDRALADYETALKLAPTNAWVLVDRGRTYARLGRSEAAKNDFDSALKLDPANEQKLRPLIEMEVAALPGQSPPSTEQKTSPQSPPAQQPASAQRPEDAVLPGQSPTVAPPQETPPPRTAPTSAPDAQTTQSGEPQRGIDCVGPLAKPDVRAMGQEIAERLKETVSGLPEVIVNIRNDDYFLAELLNNLKKNWSKLKLSDADRNEIDRMRRLVDTPPGRTGGPKTPQELDAVRSQIRACIPRMTEVLETLAQRKAEPERRKLEALRAEEERQRVQVEIDRERLEADMAAAEEYAAEARRRAAEDRRLAAEARRQAAEAAAEEKRRAGEARQRAAKAAATAKQRADKEERRAAEEEQRADEEERRAADAIQRIADDERRAFEAERAKRESEATALQIPQKAPSRETPLQSPPPQTPAQRKGQPSNADFLNLMAATGCESKYSEQKCADLFAAQKGRQMTVTGEITGVKGGRVLLRVLRDTITYDIGVTLADENAAYDLEVGRTITVSFILTQHGGCVLPYGGKDGRLVAVSR
jgi:Flp pilus assembly protein TadD